ncbi:hypothetical protein C7S17_3323 [Burkholderia thailandensis]|nr:hypothetical protein [Burkholderia thailandensis]
MHEKTVKAMAKRLLRECSISPQAIDDLTLEELVWWLTD